MKEITIQVYVTNTGSDYSYKDYMLTVDTNGVQVSCFNTDARNTKARSFEPSSSDLKIIKAIKEAMLEIGFYKGKEKHVA